jgi:hypothetical protein
VVGSQGLGRGASALNWSRGSPAVKAPLNRAYLNRDQAGRLAWLTGRVNKEQATLHKGLRAVKDLSEVRNSSEDARWLLARPAVMDEIEGWYTYVHGFSAPYVTGASLYNLHLNRAGVAKLAELNTLD